MMKEKFRSMQYVMERQILDIKLTDILQEIAKAKWRWAGHVARTDDNKLTKIRGIGMQNRRWRDESEEYVRSI